MRGRGSKIMDLYGKKNIHITNYAMLYDKIVRKQRKKQSKIRALISENIKQLISLTNDNCRSALKIM
jgi:hypothetical protein